MMSKGLSEIKTLRGFNSVELNSDENVNKSLDIIEKELKALEIIKNKRVNVNYLLYLIDCRYENEIILERYNKDRPNTKLTEDEFYLLKGVLK